MKPYDGTTSLNTALSELHGKDKEYGNSALSDITRKYKADLNLADSDKITTPEHKLFIYNKESGLVKAANKGKTKGSIVKRADKLAAKDTRTATTTFILTPEPNTPVRIYLEPEFVTALESFAPDKQAQREFLKGVALTGNSANPSSNARCAIVKALTPNLP